MKSIYLIILALRGISFMASAQSINPGAPWPATNALGRSVPASSVIFDTTNRVTYRDVYPALCDVWSQIRKEGGHTPQVCFMVNTHNAWPRRMDALFNYRYLSGADRSAGREF